MDLKKSNKEFYEEHSAEGKLYSQDLKTPRCIPDTDTNRLLAPGWNFLFACMSLVAFFFQAENFIIT
jgi:hypothetical protein